MECAVLLLGNAFFLFRHFCSIPHQLRLETAHEPKRLDSTHPAHCWVFLSVLWKRCLCLTQKECPLSPSSVPQQTCEPLLYTRCFPWFVSTLSHCHSNASPFLLCMLYPGAHACCAHEVTAFCFCPLRQGSGYLCSVLFWALFEHFSAGWPIRPLLNLPRNGFLACECPIATSVAPKSPWLKCCRSSLTLLSWKRMKTSIHSLALTCPQTLLEEESYTPSYQLFWDLANLSGSGLSGLRYALWQLSHCKGKIGHTARKPLWLHQELFNELQIIIRKKV